MTMNKILINATLLVILLMAAVCAHAEDEETLNRQSAYLDKGLLYEEEKNPRKAIAEYEKVIKIDPRTIVSAVAYHNLGTIYTDMGDLSQAMDSFTKAIEINPELAEPYAGRAYIYAEQGLFAEAIGDYTMTIKLEPEHLSAYRSRGVAFYNMGNNEEAIADIDRALKIDPEYGSKEPYLWRGRAHYSLGDFDQAVADYTVAIEANPEEAVLYNDRGVAYQNMGERELAVENYKKALELDPGGEHGQQARDNLKYLATLLTEELETSKKEGVPKGTERPGSKVSKKTHTQKTTKKMEGDDEDELLSRQFTHLEKGRFYTAENNLDKAMSEFTKAIEINPRTYNAAKAYHDRGEIYLAMDNLTQALADFTKATELDPDYVSAYFHRGGVYALQDNKAGVIANITKVIELDPNYESTMTHFGRAAAHFTLGNYGQAVADLTTTLTAIKENPDEAEIYEVSEADIYSARGFAYLNMNKYEQSVQDFKKALELDPEGEAGEKARGGLEDVAERLREELAKPKQQGLLETPKKTERPQSKKGPPQKITQKDLQTIDRLEKEWASNLDLAGQSIARQDFSAADKHLDNAMNAVTGMKKVVTDKNLDLSKVPLFDGMEKLTVVYADLGEISRLGGNGRSAIKNINHIKQLAVESYDYLEDAEVTFRAEDATGLAEVCRQLKNELTKAFDAIERETGHKVR